MEEEEAPLALTKRLAKFGIAVSADLDFSQAKEIDPELLISKIAESYSGEGLKVLTSEQLSEIVKRLKTEKILNPVEVATPSSFSPPAADIASDYSVKVRKSDSTSGTIQDFVMYFRDRLKKIRRVIEEERGSTLSIVADLDSVSKLPSGRELCAVGIVRSKSTTKNGNIMVIIEDEKATAKVIFMNSSYEKGRQLFSKASTIVNDEVLAVKGKISGPFLIANEIVWPDIPIISQKHSDEDVAVAFASDIHVGSKLFMQNNFMHMIRWLNGEVAKARDLAGKVKYLIIGGDDVDGIGIYPNQEKDLALLDFYAQYRLFFSLLEKVPDHIEIFIIPGNHDSVQLSEPQPPIESDIIKDFSLGNVHMLSNPAYIRLHGINILAYHGASLDSIIAAVPGMSYSNPEKAMIELLKRRHLAPIYGGSAMVPSRSDELVIDEVPDVLYMGHIHKNGLASYHGVDVLNSGTWQARTSYQIKQGHIPTPCIMPVLEMKSHTFNMIDFSGS
ncbi:MAG: DNA-directed DNA polymerase II small subunit [Candidatus Micrarchaeaceae archaeon]